jgi:hypothetical protein
MPLIPFIHCDEYRFTLENSQHGALGEYIEVLVSDYGSDFDDFVSERVKTSHF